MSKSVESLEAEVDSLTVNKDELERRVRRIEEYFDTLGTPVWKRLLFRVDGWGPWWQVRERPHWRPWRRWWTS